MKFIKKLFKIIAITFAVFMAIGFAATIMYPDTPEQKAARVAQKAERAAERAAEKAERIALKEAEEAKNKAKIEAEKANARATLIASRGQEYVDFYDEFESGLATLKNMDTSSTPQSISAAKFDIAARVVVLELSAKQLYQTRTMKPEAIHEQLVKDYASTLKSKQSDADLNGRLIMSRVITATLMEYGIQTKVPMWTNTTLEVYGPPVLNEKNRKDFVKNFKGDLKLVRFTNIDWKLSKDADFFARSVITSVPKDTFQFVDDDGVTQTFKYN